MPFVYILRCADESYYTGMTSNLEHRLAQHDEGSYEGYTASRRPVQLIWSEEVQTEHQAFLLERQIKGWTRAKKEALIRGDFVTVHQIVKTERQQRKRRKPPAK